MIDTFLNYSSMAKESPTVVLRDCLRTAFIHIHYLVWQDTCKVGRSKNWLVLHNHKNFCLENAKSLQLIILPAYFLDGVSLQAALLCNDTMLNDNKVCSI